MSFNFTNTSFYVINKEQTFNLNGTETIKLTLKEKDFKTQKEFEKALKSPDFVFVSGQQIKLSEKFKGKNVVVFGADKKPLEGRVSIMSEEDVAQMRAVFQQHFSKINEEKKKESERAPHEGMRPTLAEREVRVREQMPSPAVKARFERERTSEEIRLANKERREEQEVLNVKVARTRIRFYESLKAKNEAILEQKRKDLGQI